jgi:pimeloyl-ACP methyl ester carboxylesterase
MTLQHSFLVLAASFACCRPSASGPQTAAPQFEHSACWFAAPPGVFVHCGSVGVPESRNRSADRSKKVRLAVAVFSKAETPAREPLFFLSGGPGDAAVDVVRLLPSAFLPLLDHRDLIVIDQRGTGRSEPSLNCPEHDLAACRARLIRKGVDLGSYTTKENAADINDVRLALGYRQIDLFGGSYGTLLAQAIMRDFPEAVRSAVLDSAAPLQEDVQLELIRNFEPALKVLFDACHSNAACHSEYPSLREVFYKVVEQLNATPVQVRAEGGPNGSTAEFTLSGGMFAFVIWQSLYHSEAIPHLPRIIYDTANGDTGRLARLIEKERPPDIRSVGMQQSIECTEMAPFMKPEQLREAAGIISPALRQVAMAQFGDIFDRCGIWNVPPANPGVKLPLRSEIPVLLLSGAFDPATPPASARQVAQGLERHYLFVFPDSGHGVFRTSDCARGVISAFLENPGRAPSVPCLGRLPGRAFVKKDDAPVPR